MLSAIQLPLPVLLEHAKGAGVEEAKMEAAIDGEAPKEHLIHLIANISGQTSLDTQEKADKEETKKTRGDRRRKKKRKDKNKEDL